MMKSEQTTCKVCGAPITQREGGRGHRTREYCTDRCKQKAYRHRSAPLEPEPPEAQLAALTEEIQQLRQRLALEEQYRTDTEVRYFKRWLRSHQPQDIDFYRRFLADTRLPQHASRGLYEARLRHYKYSAEDILLFQEAWKDLLFQS